MFRLLCALLFLNVLLVTGCSSTDADSPGNMKDTPPIGRPVGGNQAGSLNSSGGLGPGGR